MVTKIVVKLSGKGNTTKSKVVSLIGKEIIHTKYDDIGKAKGALRSLREMEKQDENLKVIDKTRIGIVVEEHSGKTEKQLVDISLKQAHDVVNTLNKENGGNIKSSIELFKEVEGKWIKK